MIAPPTAARVLLVLGLLSAGACADDGRDLAEPAAWQTTTTRPPPPTSAMAQESSSSGMTLTSPDFTPGDVAPFDSGCDGRNVFPALSWTDPPAGTAELVITLSDQTDPNEPLLLWLAAGIPPGTRALDAGTIPAGAFETLNDFGSLGYGTPCLSEVGEGTRDMQFRLYALGSPSGLSAGDPGNTSWSNVQARATESASLLMQVDVLTTP